jgi:hypothetical protein
MAQASAACGLSNLLLVFRDSPSLWVVASATTPHAHPQWLQALKLPHKPFAAPPETAIIPSLPPC